MDSILLTFGQLLLALLGVGFLIFVHELGHFLAAKKVGIRVETFALGFQPEVFGRRLRFFAKKVGETEYVIGALPFGGYVKMAGEEATDEKTGSPDEYASKSALARAFVLVAGAGMNLIFGFLFFIVAYSIGVPTESTTIGEVQPGKPAWRSGLRSGDQVVAVDGEKIDEFTELFVKVALGSREEPLQITYERDGQQYQTETTPVLDKSRGMLGIGISPALKSEIAFVDKKSSAYEAGLRKGQKIAKLELETDELRYDLSGLSSTLQMLTVQDFGRNFGSGRLIASVQEEGSPRRLEIPLTPWSEIPEEQREKPSPRTGVQFLKTRIEGVQPGSPAGEVFAAGDEIVELEGETIGYVDVWEVLRRAGGRDKISYRLLSGKSGELLVEEFTYWLISSQIDFSEVVETPQEKSKLLVGRIFPDSAAERAGLRPRDEIISVNGQKVESFEDYRDLVVGRSGDSGQSIELEVRRQGTTEKISFTTEPIPVSQGYFGFVFKSDRFIKQASILGSAKLGYQQTVTWSVRVFLTLKALATRDVEAKNLSGPVGIIATTRVTFSQGFVKALWFLALVSVNLGIFNLLPFPILDGGHLLFLLIEKIKGSPVSDAVLNYTHLIAFILLICLALFVTWNDIKRHILPFL